MVQTIIYQALNKFSTFSIFTGAALAASAHERGDGGRERDSVKQQRETRGACSALAVPWPI